MTYLIPRGRNSQTRDSCNADKSRYHKICNANVFGAIHKASMTQTHVGLGDMHTSYPRCSNAGTALHHSDDSAIVARVCTVGNDLAWNPE